MAQSGYAILDLNEYGFEDFKSKEEDLDYPVEFYKKVVDLYKLGKPLIVINLIDKESGVVIKSAHATINDETNGNFEIYINVGNIVYDISLSFDNIYVVKYKYIELKVQE